MGTAALMAQSRAGFRAGERDICRWHGPRGQRLILTSQGRLVELQPRRNDHATTAVYTELRARCTLATAERLAAERGYTARLDDSPRQPTCEPSAKPRRPLHGHGGNDYRVLSVESRARHTARILAEQARVDREIPEHEREQHTHYPVCACGRFMHPTKTKTKECSGCAKERERREKEEAAAPEPVPASPEDIGRLWCDWDMELLARRRAALGWCG